MIQRPSPKIPANPLILGGRGEGGYQYQTVNSRAGGRHLRRLSITRVAKCWQRGKGGASLLVSSRVQFDRELRTAFSTIGHPRSSRYGGWLSSKPLTLDCCARSRSPTSPSTSNLRSTAYPASAFFPSNAS